jgi:glycogen debranching enzyme
MTDPKIINGISNQGKNLEKSYLTAGEKSYIVGLQDGTFPDIGNHVKGEMGGFWMLPIKLLDGIWIEICETGNNTYRLIDKASEFINYPYGNKFIFPGKADSIDIERFQFCPQNKQGMVINYTFKNTSKRLRSYNLKIIVKTDLSPVWFSKENNIIDAYDSIVWDKKESVFYSFDTKNKWFTVWGSTLATLNYSFKEESNIKTIGLGKSASTFHSIELKAGESKTITFVVSGSTQSLESAFKVFDDIMENHTQLLSDNISYFEKTINRAEIEIPDKKLQEAYSWGKINTDWLVSEIDGIGRFLGAGAIEYPWLFGCDNSYALQGVVCSGDLELAKSTLRIIKKVSEAANGNGRIIHEMSSNGFVGNKGNTQETPHFAIAVWKVFQWTGDIDFLKEMYPYIKLGLNWLFTDKDLNGNLFPEGYGIMEVRGLNAELIDVSVYTQQAFVVASKMAEIFNEPDFKIEFEEKAEKLKNAINAHFWDENENSYCDFYGTQEQAVTTIKGAIEQLQISSSNGGNNSELINKQNYYLELLDEFSKLPSDTSKGWLTNKNWVINTPMEMGIAPNDKAIILLNKIKRDHCGSYGPYLSAVEKSHMMTIATGVQAMAEASYGRTDESLWYVNKIVQTFSMALPGSISEMMPDYGCPVQAWTIYGLAVPLITHFFGIQPDAYNKKVTFEPHLPSNWDKIAIKNLPVGNNNISFSVLKSNKSIEYEIISERIDWNFILPLNDSIKYEVFVNKKKIKNQTSEIVLNGKSNKVRINYL